MSPALVLLILRAALAVLVFAFLGLILFWQVRDLQAAARPAQSPPWASLRVEEGPSAGSTHALRGENLLGRAADNSICLSDVTVSNYHARLSFQSGQWWLEDLGSRNGTRVNGTPLQGPLVVTFDDEICLGEVRLRMLPGLGDGRPANPVQPSS